MNTQGGKILTITLNASIDKVYVVDGFAVGGVYRPREMTATAGGKGLNVARVAHLLGEKVVASGFIGGGNGRFIQKQARESGINTDFESIQGESRICINITDPINHLCTEVLEPGPTISEDECGRFLERYRHLLDDCIVVCVSGSLPKGIPTNFYYHLIETATAKGVPFILDTSGEALVQGIQGKPYMIKPNLEELQKFFGLDCTTLDEQAKAVQKLKNSGIAMPCLTLGKMGCVVALAEGIFHFFGPLLEVVNTVGSGDSFVAGCAVGVARGMEAMDIIKLGMACGMANTQFLKTGMVSEELVSKYFKQIEYHIIK